VKNVTLIAFLFLIGCSSKKEMNQSQTDSIPANIPITGKLFATAYQQTAGEYRALCLQAYNIAHERVDEAIKEKKLGKHPAIITDIDETLLDNSPWQAHQSLQGKGYDSTSWKEWSDKAEADTVPGATSFLKYAASKGIEIFYITNRSNDERVKTLENLKKYNFPNVDPSHLYTKWDKDSTSKETRRHLVMRTNDILMLLGDNLGDFISAFDKKQLAERSRNVDSLSNLFGYRFIVLPNPGYGDWESSIYQYKKWNKTQKDSILKAILKTY
jgi:5'-nucleotidase (lipoprotein e(P4) family)